MPLRYVPPPPTMFPGTRAAQPKAGAPIIAPPPTRFGATPAIPLKAVAPLPPRPPASPPRHAPAAPVQLRPALAAYRLPAAPPPVAAVIQAMRKRKDIGSKDNSPAKKKKDDKEKKTDAKFVWEKYGANQSETRHLFPVDFKLGKTGSVLNKLYENTTQIRYPRSYSLERPKQMLRWLATTLFASYPEGVEIQCYYHVGSKKLYVSSNKTKVNRSITEAFKDGWVKALDKIKIKLTTPRQIRHGKKLLERKNDKKQTPIWTALEEGNVVVPVPDKDYDVDFHAERRIRDAVGKNLDPAYLGGVKRPCMVCALALKFENARRGPFWRSKAACSGYTEEQILKHGVEHGVITYVTAERVSKEVKTTTSKSKNNNTNRKKKDEKKSKKKIAKKKPALKLHIDYDSESDSDAE